MQVDKMLLGGCSNVGPQTVQYCAKSQKFAYVADAHCYIYDTSGVCRLDSIIPFCETVQSKHVEEQKVASNLSEDVGKSMKEVNEAKFAGMLFGIDIEKDIWGGVGLQAIVWSPHEENVLAAITLKTNRLEIWNVKSGVMLAIADLRDAIFELQWSPHDQNLLVGRKKDSACIYRIDCKTGKQTKLSLGNKVTSMTWHPRRPNFLFLGSSAGFVSLYNITEQHQELNFSIPFQGTFEPGVVKDIVYSPGEDVFLVIRADGSIYLFGAQEKEIKMTFAPTQGGVSRAVWIDAVSGDFLVSSAASGALRVYNAANPACKEIIKMSSHGIQDLQKMTDAVYLIKLVNGQIIQFNIRTRCTLFITEVGHTHQIQRAKIRDLKGDMMATTGFDGTVRKWNLNNMKLESIFQQKNISRADQIIQCIAWCKMKPPKGMPADAYQNLVVIGTSAGKVKLVDLGKNKVLNQFQLQGPQLQEEPIIFTIDWNKDGILAIGSTNWSFNILQYEPENTKFAEFAQVESQCGQRCVSFSPHKPNLLAIGLFNGGLMIYDTDLKKVKQVMKPSTSRILCVEWHPQFEYIVATGSFDHIVRIHDTKYNGVKELAFHTDRVRSLQWSTEVPWLLTSGGDDSRQAVWDIRNRQLIFACAEPTLAMTSFTSHSQRPFTYYSSHFDASLIQWSLLAIPDIALTQLKFLLKCTEDDIICPDPNLIMTNDIKARITGDASKALFQEIKSLENLERCERILKFYQGLDGQEELWAMAHIIKGDGPGLDTEKLRVHHITDTTAAYSSKAYELIEANPMSMLGTSLSKKEDRMQEAARLNLISGNFQQYCEIQMQLGNFEDALAVAPKVSLKYWQKCLDGYRAHLSGEISTGQSSTKTKNDPSEEYVEYSILAGDYDAAVQTLENTKQTKAAKTVKFVQLAGGFPDSKVTARHKAVNNVDPNQPAPVPLFELGPDQLELKEFTDQEANARFTQGQPLLSAACHLSLSDTKSAIQKLLLANLPEFAYVLAKELLPEALDQVLIMLFEKTHFYEQMSISNSILEQIKNRQVKEIIEAGLYINNQGGEVGEIRSSDATSAPKQDSTVFDNIIGQRLDEAVQIALTNQNKVNSVSGPTNTIRITLKYLEDHYFLSFIDLSTVQPDLYSQLLPSYRDIALIKALYWRMFPVYRWLMQSSAHGSLGQTPILAQLKDFAGLNDAELEAKIAQSEFIQLNFQVLEEHLKVYLPCFVGNFRLHEMHHLDTHKKKSFTRQQAQIQHSLISGRPISHYDICINLSMGGGSATNAGCLSLEDALDLSQCMSFNPLDQENKDRLSPFKLHFNQKIAQLKLGIYI